MNREKVYYWLLNTVLIFNNIKLMIVYHSIQVPIQIMIQIYLLISTNDNYNCI
jgi:hypothetical protein